MIKIPKLFHVLVYIKFNCGCCIHDISKTLDITYCHTHKVICKLIEFKLIEVEKIGRKKIIVITDNGIKISNSIITIFKSFNINYLTSEKFEKLPLKTKHL